MENERGLCSRCRYARIVRSGKGSQFLLCGRSLEDTSFPKYPRLPVLKCRGYEPSENEKSAPRDAGRTPS